MNLYLERARDDAGYRSWDGLADALRKKYPDTHFTTKRALGTKLGQLSRGENIQWWTNHPDRLEMLTEFLGITAEDMGIHPNQRQLNRYTFEDFPELHPLDLSRESPCQLGHFIDCEGNSTDGPTEWLRQDRVRFSPAGITWLYFPPGTGLDIFWAYLRSNTAVECRETTSISDEAERLKQRKPICLYIKDSKGARDRLALMSRNEDCAVLVCAPFKRNMDIEDKIKSGFLSDVFSDHKIKDYTWRLNTGWQLQLLRWVEKRLATHPDTVFDANGMASWLSTFYDESIFDTPRSLIEVCRFAHHYGHKKLPNGKDWKAGSKLIELLGSESEARNNTFKRLIYDWFNSLFLPWNNAISSTQWSQFTKSNTAKKLSEQIAKETEEEVRRELLHKYETSLIEEVELDLIDSRFIHQSELGEVSLSPRFMVNLIAREEVYKHLIDIKQNEWASVCYDPIRFDLLQQALSLLRIADLELIASRVLQDFQENAHSVGAAEAIFCAIGHHGPGDISAHASLTAIAEMTLARMLRTQTTTPTTWSSACLSYPLWITTCWQLSFSISKPSLPIPINWQEYFPGWYFRDYDIDWKTEFLKIEDSTKLDALSGAEKRFLKCCEYLVQLTDKQPKNPPSVLTPFLIAKSLTNGMNIPNQWWTDTLRNIWSCEIIVDQIDNNSNMATEGLISILQLMSAKGVKLSIREWINLEVSGLLTKLLFSANEQRFSAQLSDHDLVKSRQFFKYMPSSMRIHILKRYCIHKNKEIVFWLDIINHLKADDVDSIIPLFGENLLGSMLAEWLWINYPEKAYQYLNMPTESINLKTLILGYRTSETSSPSTHYLLDASNAIKNNLHLFSYNEISAWVINHLPTSGQYADELISLLHKTNAPKCPK